MTFFTIKIHHIHIYNLTTQPYSYFNTRIYLRQRIECIFVYYKSNNNNQALTRSSKNKIKKRNDKVMFKSK